MAPCESVSAPLAVGVLTHGSFMAQCQLLHQRCVTHLHAVCCISGEGSTTFNKQVLSLKLLGCWFLLYNESGPAPNISGGTAVFCYLHGDIAGCAALKQSITKALAVYAASPFLIEGM